MDTLAAPDMLARMRPSLMRFAHIHLRNNTWAEDVVSETMLVALEHLDSFEARSRFQTWVIGILKHKIIDLQRWMQREVSLETAFVEFDEVEDFDGPLRSNHTSLHAPAESRDPALEIAERQFLQRMQRCIDRLPAVQARAFVMRAWLGYSTEEVCAALSITSSNCNVMMFRTRSRLREAIEHGDYQRSNRGPSSAPAAALTPIPATYQTARNGDCISGQRSA